MVVCKEEQTSPVTARLPWCASDTWDEWHCRLTSAECQWQMRETSTNQKEDTPIIHGALGEWVICYRFEYITRTDVNISGVKAETLRFIRTSVSLLCMFNMSWEETETILSYYWSETEELSPFSKLKHCHQKTSENRYNVFQGFHAKEHA